MTRKLSLPGCAYSISLSGDSRTADFQTLMALNSSQDNKNAVNALLQLILNQLWLWHEVKQANLLVWDVRTKIRSLGSVSSHGDKKFKVSKKIFSFLRIEHYQTFGIVRSDSSCTLYLFVSEAWEPTQRKHLWWKKSFNLKNRCFKKHKKSQKSFHFFMTTRAARTKSDWSAVDNLGLIAE